MYRPITRYRTGDGAVHETENAAREHVRRSISTEIIRQVLSVNSDHVSIDGSTAYAIADAIYKNRAALKTALDLEEY